MDVRTRLIDPPAARPHGPSLNGLASNEVCCIMRLLPRGSLLQLARCSRQLYLDADCTSVWAGHEPAECSVRTPYSASRLLRHVPVYVWLFAEHEGEIMETPWPRSVPDYDTALRNAGTLVSVRYRGDLTPLCRRLLMMALRNSVKTITLILEGPEQPQQEDHNDPWYDPPPPIPRNLVAGDSALRLLLPLAHLISLRLCWEDDPLNDCRSPCREREASVAALRTLADLAHLTNLSLTYKWASVFLDVLFTGSAAAGMDAPLFHALQTLTLERLRLPEPSPGNAAHNAYADFYAVRWCRGSLSHLRRLAHLELLDTQLAVSLPNVASISTLQALHLKTQFSSMLPTNDALLALLDSAPHLAVTITTSAFALRSYSPLSPRITLIPA